MVTPVSKNALEKRSYSAMSCLIGNSKKKKSQNQNHRRNEQKLASPAPVASAMGDEDSGLGQLVESMKVDEQSKQLNAADDASDNSSVQITCFSDLVNDVTLHFQIIRLPNQIYAWIGCNSSKLGHLYAAAPTRPNNTVSVTSILGGVSDNTGSGIARRIVLKTGLNVILACNIPKDSLMLEASAEKKLVEKLISLGYTRHKSHS